MENAPLVAQDNFSDDGSEERPVSGMEKIEAKIEEEIGPKFDIFGNEIQSLGK